MPQHYVCPFRPATTDSVEAARPVSELKLRAETELRAAAQPSPQSTLW